MTEENNNTPPDFQIDTSSISRKEPAAWIKEFKEKINAAGYSVERINAAILEYEKNSESYNLVNKLKQGESMMPNEEYKDFLKYVFDEYIQPRIGRTLRHWDHPKRFHSWDYEWRKLKKAVDLVNYINSHCDDNDEIYRTFKVDRLRKAVDEVNDGLRFNNRIAEEFGFLDAIDSHYSEIIEGLDVELFPESEIQLLQEFGFKHPKSNLRGIIYLLKSRNKQKYRSSNEMSVYNQLKSTADNLSDAKNYFKELDKDLIEKKEKPKKSRRWFKGLGQIGQGAALSIGDIALAAGMLKFPVSPETQTWGALVSATTGVGMIMSGVGELRGE